jgi:protein-arginine kinase activator protein McsA
MRKCYRCGKSKKLIEYPKQSNAKQGRSTVCKACKVEKMQIRLFGMTTKDALKITKVCHICNIKLSNTIVCIDHDHKTGQVRGILCTGCNTAIGKLGDSISGLKRAVNYLKKPPLI